MSSKKLFKSRAPLVVQQDALRGKAKHIVVDKSRFLCFIENGQGRTPILFERNPQGVKVIVDYSAEYDFNLTALQDPAAILAAITLTDDAARTFSKTCSVCCATWQAAAPAYDLVIATKKIPGFTTTGNEAITWWKVNGQDKQEPPAPCTLQTPAIVERLASYELADTQCTGFEVVRRYRKIAGNTGLVPEVTSQPITSDWLTQIDALTIARQARATHKDRDGNFYKSGPSGVMVGQVVNGQIDWQLSRYYHMPEFTEVI